MGSQTRTGVIRVCTCSLWKSEGGKYQSRGGKKVYLLFLRCLKGLAWACILTYEFSADSSGRVVIYDAIKNYFPFSVLED